MTSPTERTLKKCREEGELVDKVEYWNQFARKRKDLFGIIDIVAVDGFTTYGIQCTTKSNMGARVKKILASEALEPLLKAGWKIEVWGWFKKNNRWNYEVERIVYGNLRADEARRRKRGRKNNTKR